MRCNCNTEDNCQPTACTCKVRLNSDCITVSGATTECSNIDDNLTLTDFLSQQDAYICEKVDSVSGFTTLRNVGTGVEIYKGIDSIGRKEIRRIKSTDNSVTITQNTTDIDLSVAVPNGTETKIVAGTDITVTGQGTVGNPYMVTSTARPYKVYTALLTQSGTNAPVATVLGDNTIGNIVWSRQAAGEYYGTLAGAFTNPTLVFITPSTGGAPALISVAKLTNSVVSLMCEDLNGGNGDGRLLSTPMEIRVY
jgi:hypothetical protein